MCSGIGFPEKFASSEQQTMDGSGGAGGSAPVAHSGLACQVQAVRFKAYFGLL